MTPVHILVIFINFHKYLYKKVYIRMNAGIIVETVTANLIDKSKFFTAATYYKLAASTTRNS